MRYVGNAGGDLASLLRYFTKENYGDDWFKWMSWLQAQPEIKHPSINSHLL